MLLTDLKAVTEIDTQISILHKQLEDLYEVRANCIYQGKSLQQSATPTSNYSSYRTINTNIATNQYSATKGLALQEYERLVAIWSNYDIKLPAFSTFQERLETAHKLIDRIVESRSEFSNSLGVMLVPPTQLFNMNSYQEMLFQKHAAPAVACINPELGHGTKSKKWRIFIVHTAQQGVKYGTAAQILANKSYIIAGHDMRALGLIEYAALTLQSQSIIDDNSWTLLLRNHHKNKGRLVPSVAYIGQSYKFEQDDEIGLLDDDYFRPAVEVR
ncbi:hypothetical protein BH23PAT1_BH23PAT1_4880 [soil metagenome]